MSDATPQEEQDWRELAERLGSSEAELKDPPRPMFKHLAWYKLEVYTAANEAMSKGWCKGAYAARLRAYPLDENDKPVKRASAFIDVPYPINTDGFQFTLENKERARRNICALIEASGDPAYLAYATRQLIGTKSVYYDKAGEQIPNIADMFKKARFKVLKEMADRKDGAPERFLGTRFYAQCYISETPDKRKFTNWQNFRGEPPAQPVLTDSSKMLEWPTGAASDEKPKDTDLF